MADEDSEVEGKIVVQQTRAKRKHQDEEDEGPSMPRAKRRQVEPASKPKGIVTTGQSGQKTAVIPMNPQQLNRRKSGTAKKELQQIMQKSKRR